MNICTVSSCDNCGVALSPQHNHLSTQHDLFHLCSGCIAKTETMQPQNQGTSVFEDAQKAWSAHIASVEQQACRRRNQ